MQLRTAWRIAYPLVAGPVATALSARAASLLCRPVTIPMIWTWIGLDSAAILAAIAADRPVERAVLWLLARRR